jgi:hypothetical protein
LIIAQKLFILAQYFKSLNFKNTKKKSSNGSNEQQSTKP